MKKISKEIMHSGVILKKSSLPAVVVANDCSAETKIKNLKLHTLKQLTQFIIVD